jgi:hypothetical protein
MLDVFAKGLILAGLSLPVSFLIASDPALPTSSVMAFLIGLVCLALPALDALYVERAMEKDAPFWRFRYASHISCSAFVAFCLLYGISLPSTGAFVILLWAVAFGAILAWTVQHDRVTPPIDRFDPERTMSRRGKADRSWQVFGGVQLILPLVFSVFTVGGTAPAVYLLVFGTGQFHLLPYPLRTLARWRERALLTVFGIGASLAGLFLA